MQYENMYLDEHEQRLRIKKSNRSLVILLILLILLLVYTVFAKVLIGVAWMSPAFFISVIKGNVQSLIWWMQGKSYVNAIDQSVYQAVLIALAGAALAVCGTIFQGSFKNAMASPGTLGVQSGGTLGATLYIVFFSSLGYVSATSNHFSDIQAAYESQSLIQHNIQEVFTFLGCLAGVFFTVAIAKTAGRGKLNTVALIISGTVFSSLVGSFSGFIQYFFLLTETGSERATALRYILLGSFTNVNSLEDLILMGIPVVFCLTLILALRNKLNVLVFGEEEARTMGLRVDFYRNIFIALSTALTAIVLSFCGHIGFIGLMVPHVTRFIVGPNFKILIPASMMMGSVILLLIFNIAYMFGYSDAIGLITNIVGGTIFAIIMLVNRRKRNADWV